MAAQPGAKELRERSRSRTQVEADAVFHFGQVEWLGIHCVYIHTLRRFVKAIGFGFPEDQPSWAKKSSPVSRGSDGVRF
jgi:hypothetical protein